MGACVLSLVDFCICEELSCGVFLSVGLDAGEGLLGGVLLGKVLLGEVFPGEVPLGEVVSPGGGLFGGVSPGGGLLGGVLLEGVLLGGVLLEGVVSPGGGLFGGLSFRGGALLEEVLLGEVLLGEVLLGEVASLRGGLSGGEFPVPGWNSVGGGSLGGFPGSSCWGGRATALEIDVDGTLEVELQELNVEVGVNDATLDEADDFDSEVDGVKSDVVGFARLLVELAGN